MTFPNSLPASRVPPPTEAPVLRWGILGTGWIAGKFIESVRAHTAQDIAAVGSRGQATASAFAARHGLARAHGSYEALVAAEDLDVIYVATPHNLHHAHVRLALEAGKHVLVEKPMALNHAQAADLVALARSRNLFLAEALWTYFLPKFDVLQQLRDSGILGEIRSVHTDYGEHFTRDHRIFDPGLAGGPLLDLGTYPVSLLVKLLGVPAGVVGVGQPDPSGVNGQLSAILTNAAGNQGTLSTTLYGFTPTNAVIVGSGGSLRFGSAFNMPGPFEVISADGGSVLRYDEAPAGHLQGLCFEAAEVARCIAAGRSETACRPLRDTLDTMASLDMIRRAVGIRFDAAGLVE